MPRPIFNSAQREPLFRQLPREFPAGVDAEHTADSTDHKRPSHSQPERLAGGPADVAAQCRANQDAQLHHAAVHDEIGPRTRTPNPEGRLISTLPPVGFTVYSPAQEGIYRFP